MEGLETIDDGENDENERLVVAFNDAGVSDEEFAQMLAEECQNNKAFARLGRRVSGIA